MCPVCQNPLFNKEKNYICKNNHSYDISKKGYVNLLMSNSSKEKRHGDDKMMVEARKKFLELGYYLPLSKAVSKLVAEIEMKNNRPTLFECGCGECYYLNEVKNELENKNIHPDIYGMDISKEALPFGKKRVIDSTLFVGSAYKLPIMNESVDVALSIFAPMDLCEMARVVKKGGCVIKVIPLENHLIELKEKLYDDVYLNRPTIDSNESFIKASYEKLEYKFTLASKEEIESLFKMTPYYYKTGAKAQESLLSLNTLEVTASFGLIKYVKK